MHCTDILNKTGVVDLFCGIGGMTHGFVQSGFKILAGIDFDITCKKTYELNNNSTFIHSDLSTPDIHIIKKLFINKQVKILIGCAPCQPFSTYSYKNNDEKKWSLLRSFAKIIQEIKPDIISMENVPGLLRFKKDNIYYDFIETLTKEGFYISENIVFCPEYGIPQKRKRLVLLASKLAKIELEEPIYNKNNFLTVKDAISHMPSIKAGERQEVVPIFSTVFRLK